MKKIIFASKNRGKIFEVRDILNDCNVELISLLDFSDTPVIQETGSTFEENAILKAKIVYDTYKIPTLGDDSGIEVEQLGWTPGVYSARYSGIDATDEQNNQKLIAELSKFPEPHNARYVCCSVYYDGKTINTTFGEVKGKITKYPKGNNGFGYDPYFIPDGFDVTIAQLSSEIKNSISHRFKAFDSLKKFLK